MEEAGIPAMNELRYAGYHLLHALTDDSEPVSEQMTKAINHCKRAAYEAAEAGQLSCLKKVSIFKNDYKSVVVSEVVPDWSQILADCDKFKSGISGARSQGDEKINYFRIHMNAFGTLKEICVRLDHAREDLNKKMQNSISSQRRFVVTTSLTILAIAVAILIAIIS